MVAATTLLGLLERRLLARMSLMPAASITARTAPPAMMLDQHAAGAESAENFVRDRGARQRDGVHVLLRIFNSLADRFADFAGLAHAEADLALAVADDHERGELHNAAALDGLADAIEGNELLDILGAFLPAAAVVAAIVTICHNSFPPPA